jgi:hypothetical protein
MLKYAESWKRSALLKGEPVNIDIELIKQRLFSEPVVRTRILRDYGIPFEPADTEAMAAAVGGQLGQATATHHLEQALSNAYVFRAAVRPSVATAGRG